MCKPMKVLAALAAIALFFWIAIRCYQNNIAPRRERARALSRMEETAQQWRDSDAKTIYDDGR